MSKRTCSNALKHAIRCHESWRPQPFFLSMVHSASISRTVAGTVAWLSGRIGTRAHTDEYHLLRRSGCARGTHGKACT